MAQEVRMKQNWVKRTLIVVFWIAVWQIASMAMGSGLILASPLDTVQALCVQVAKPTFWSIVWFSFARIVGGFLASFLLALALGALAHRFTFLRDLLLPVVTVFKTVPVVCLIVLLLIWFGSKNVSGIAVFLVVFPGIYFACSKRATTSIRRLPRCCTSTASPPGDACSSRSGRRRYRFCNPPARSWWA